VRGWAVCQLR